MLQRPKVVPIGRLDIRLISCLHRSQMCPDSRRKLQPQDPECYHLTMSTEEHITQLTAQIAALQAQLVHCSRSLPPPQPSAPPPPLKPPKASTPSPFAGAQDNLDCFK